MARTPDRQLKERILDVAQALLRTQGEKGLTIRAVADAAGTTTPTIYKRFPNKESMLVALALRERERYVTRMVQRRSLESAVTGYLDWAAQHPHEYQLIYGHHWPQVFSEETGRPGLEWTKQKLASRHGGQPEDYVLITSALWLLLHGAASLLTQHPEGQGSDRVREDCIAACSKLLEEAPKFRRKPGPKDN